MAFLQSSKYFLLFGAALLEGPAASLTSGFLLKLGQVQFVPVYVALVAGDLAADIGWYCLGRFGTRALVLRFGRLVGITPEALATVERRFNRYHQRILFISKLTMGFGFAIVTLTVAGMSRVPFRSFFLLNLVGGLIWTLFLLGIGHSFGNVYTMVSGEAKVLFLIVAGAVLILTFRYANRYLMSKDL